MYGACDTQNQPITVVAGRVDTGMRPPVTHPIFFTHPITGKKVLYANPGYAVSINGMSAQESDEMLTFLFAHQLPEKFRYLYTWTEGDV